MARQLIPLHDATQPIACTIEAAAVPDRIALLERLRAGMQRLDTTEHGFVLHLEAEREDDARRFAVDEQRCCSFFGFAVEAQPDEITLRWDVPPTAADLRARLQAWLEGDEPLTTLSGLL